MEKLTLTVKEAAEALGVCLAHFYKLMNRAEHPVPTMKLGDRNVGKSRRLVSIDALKKWIEEETEMTMKGRN